MAEEQDVPQAQKISQTGSAQDDPSRRGVLKAASLAIGGVLAAFAAYPIVRYVLFPVGRKTVSGAAEPIDVLEDGQLKAGGAPVKVELVGEGVQNAWAVSDDVRLGAAWVRKGEDGKVTALSSVCPHLGCAIGFNEGTKEYRCPCHRSSFSLDGEKKAGPSKRGLDPLPVEVEDGRVRVTFVRFKQDVAEREPV